MSHTQINATPGVCGGYPVIADTRISVRFIVESARQTGSATATAEDFPQLTLAQIQAALDYYAEFPARVDEDIARNAQALEDIRARR